MDVDVTSVGARSYIEHFERLFPELLRVVRPGGVVAFTHRGAPPPPAMDTFQKFVFSGCFKRGCFAQGASPRLIAKLYSS